GPLPMHQTLREHPHPPRRRRSLPVACATLLILGAVAAARSVVIVDQAELVYVTEFGRPVRLLTEPGLYRKWPHQSRRGFDVRLRRLNYPAEVREAVFEQIRSERRRVAAATRAEGESRARAIRSAADRERSRTVAEAEGDAARLVGEGEAAATRIANEAHSAD